MLDKHLFALRGAVLAGSLAGGADVRGLSRRLLLLRLPLLPQELSLLPVPMDTKTTMRFVNVHELRHTTEARPAAFSCFACRCRRRNAI